MEQKKYEAVNEILNDGYGDAIAKTLINVVPDVMDSVVANGMVRDEDASNVRNLLWLFKAILKDEHGIDYGVY